MYQQMLDKNPRRADTILDVELTPFLMFHMERTLMYHMERTWYKRMGLFWEPAIRTGAKRILLKIPYSSQDTVAAWPRRRIVYHPCLFCSTARDLEEEATVPPRTEVESERAVGVEICRCH